MRVKSLVWEWCDSEQNAQTSFGTYSVFLIGKLWRISFCWGIAYQSMGKFDEEDAAKAAAQSDFERRVRECLEVE
jgi:hypothetical protein